MSDLSVFIDESGTQEGVTDYYIVALVLHDQSVSLGFALEEYRAALISRNLPDIPFHANPLLRGRNAYSDLTPEVRKKLLLTFATFVRQAPIRYTSFCYSRRDFGSPEQLQALLRRDLAGFIFANLSVFQAFDCVKIYYDDGQNAVTRAVHSAFEYALARDVPVYKEADNSCFRLSQAADYLCAIELAAVKYGCGKITPSEERFFGRVGNFKKNWLKQVRRKRLDY